MAFMNEVEAFKDTVEKFISEQEMTPTAFGKKFASDPRFVFQLREGREPRTSTRNKVLSLLPSPGERP